MPVALSRPAFRLLAAAILMAAAGTAEAKRVDDNRSNEDDVWEFWNTENCEACNLRYENFSGVQKPDGGSYVLADFSHSNFSGAILTEVDMSRATLVDVDFRNLKATGCEFEGAVLDGADFTGAVIRQSNLLNATGGRFDGAIICGTTMPNGTLNNSGCEK